MKPKWIKYYFMEVDGFYEEGSTPENNLETSQFGLGKSQRKKYELTKAKCRNEQHSAGNLGVP